MSPPRLRCWPGLLVLLLWVVTAAAIAERQIVPHDTAPVGFGLRKLEAAFAERGIKSQPLLGDAATLPGLLLRTNAVGLGREGFRFAWLTRGATRQLEISAEAVPGLMYGLLELAEQIRLGVPWEEIPATEVRARFEFRAIKFNLPWAAYRTSAAIEQHQQTCKDLKFWEAFLDMMAENRFNALTLWSLHPFHYLTVPKSFPEAKTFTDAELAEYRALFTTIFKLAKERGIETHLINWNTFVSPAFAKAHNVAPWSVEWKHFGPGTTNPIVVDYTRECVTQVIDEYPDLTGLGITLGERMGEQNPDERRDWLQQTFFDGIAKAKRPVKFIYRAPLSADTKSSGTTSEENDRRTRMQIESLTNNITGPVLVEFKHNWSHAHSSPDLFIVHGGKLSDAYWNPAPTRHQVVWTMRNEDLFILRWGQPDFVRQFIAAQAGRDHVGGVIIGSECYIPALDYLTKEGPHKNWKYAFERQWLFYRVWGRLLYNAGTADREFEREFEARFGRGRGETLLAAWKLAGQVPLHFASFHQGRADGTLYTEGFSSWRDNGERKLFDIDSFITHPVLDTKRYQNIFDFVAGKGDMPVGVLSPSALAMELDRIAAQTTKLVRAIRQIGSVSQPLECELTDLDAWGAFARYFAEKLRAGVALAQARATGNVALQQSAVAALDRAQGHWRRLSELGARFNQLPAPSNSKEPFSWASLQPAVARDIELARTPLSGRTTVSTNNLTPRK